ncbi:hypothetical protein [Cryobacterium sp. PH29-G1]|uniref:hypothetical protein n=1 Tax=Cryobacterium sp. PH29-G1 TaxID=3046211 RepID=UPI0024B9C07D|nr:hypothetical protein [Cryobacterium sp. PH29-G1]MDJ0350641.1 hypothetical protein [Cryobacterium sp. PH29-G1]
MMDDLAHAASVHNGGAVCRSQADGSQHGFVRSNDSAARVDYRHVVVEEGLLG